jgi:hypothetical protein
MIGASPMTKSDDKVRRFVVQHHHVM